MIERHQAKYRRLREAAPEGERARQTTTELLSEIRRAVDHSERHPAEAERATGPPTGKANRVDWEMIMIWGFVVFSFAALAFAGYVIWAKCHGNSPF